jgi:hypothetical protein
MKGRDGWCRRASPALCLGAITLVAAACSNINPTTTATANGPTVTRVYAAIGDDGSSGFGSPVDFGSTWPQLFYRSAFGTAGIFYDFSEPGQTAAAALRGTLPQVRAIRPDVVSVFVSPADLVDGTPAPVYGGDLERLVEPLRAEGAVVLVANAVPLELIPAFDPCPARAAGCAAVPGQAVAAGAVSAYDAATAAVARETGSIVVDVHAALADALTRGGGVGLLSPSGTSLTAAGAEFVARTFRASLPKREPRRH